MTSLKLCIATTDMGDGQCPQIARSHEHYCADHLIDNLKSQLSLANQVIELLEKSNEFYGDPENWIGCNNDSTQICHDDNQTNSLYAQKFTKEEPMGLRGKGDFIGGKLARSTKAQVEKMKEGMK